MVGLLVFGWVWCFGLCCPVVIDCLIVCCVACLLFRLLLDFRCSVLVVLVCCCGVYAVMCSFVACVGGGCSRCFPSVFCGLVITCGGWCLLWCFCLRLSFVLRLFGVIGLFGVFIWWLSVYCGCGCGWLVIWLGC